DYYCASWDNSLNSPLF
nr:immunoglobulin light chain junction region [Macaca mulatta]MOV95992.1 immunoglobulin light chain junction region [Macaca mulatta]MOV96452.1 immunoglobulin light chain junction region [Macaca mulatta]MOV97407.1 immunoglobulin light chain junction region [Macaca mulatta]MOV98557.1 immunoglobulin light chain junction region [Macaca mulatta]